MSRFAICAEHFIKPNAMVAWLELAKANSAASLKEAGCHRFDVLVDRNDPNHAFIYEIYATRADWLAHCEQPHFKTFVAGIPELIVRRLRNEFDLLT